MGQKLPISVVIPCYECSSTIDAAVESVLAQSCIPAEVFLIDDCSGDDSLHELERLRDMHPDIVRVISMPQNRGPGIARNAGWEASTQPWIAFLDADDVWHPQKLELQWGWLKNHPEAALCGHQTRLLEKPMQPLEPLCTRATRLSLTQMLISNRLPTRSVMIRKDLPFRFGGKEVSEDYLLWLEVIATKHPAYKLEACLAYSQRPEHSVGGYSGNLWKHEKRELNCLMYLRARHNLPSTDFAMTFAWSYVKYLRRLLIRKLRIAR